MSVTAKKRKKPAFIARQRRIGLYLMLPSALTLLAVSLYPLLYGMFLSFWNTNLVNKWNWAGLRYYIEYLTKPEFYERTWLTLRFTFFVVLGHIVVGMLIAIMLNKRNVRGMTFFRAIMILPWLIPEVVIGNIWKWIYNPMYGLLNNFLVMLGVPEAHNILWLSSVDMALPSVIFVCIWKGYPMIMMMSLAGLQSIPDELIEAATVDGANRWQVFWHVTVPSLIPVILFIFIIDTVWWFKHFNLVWVLTSGGPAGATNLLSVDIYTKAFSSFQWGRASALAVLVMFICFILGAIYRKALEAK